MARQSRTSLGRSWYFEITRAVGEGETGTFIALPIFKAAETEAQEGRNPATGDTRRIAASCTPKFVPRKAFKQQIHGGVHQPSLILDAQRTTHCPGEETVPAMQCLSDSCQTYQGHGP
ncbi:HU family DNA-binding protein [Methylotetracoccus oryzae]|uniref:HU family DNA-binding protein n=1 Tax=Methylotetracoccus oryzae TaxID=1919059 RepID=UPI00111B709F